MTSALRAATTETAWSGVAAVAAATGARLDVDLVSAPSDAGLAARVLVLTGALVLDAVTAAHLRAEAAAGATVVVSTAPATDLAALGAEVGEQGLARPSPHDPIVFDTHRRAEGVGVLGGLMLEADDLAPVRLDRGEPLAVVDAQVVARRLAVGDGAIVVVGSVTWLRNRWISASDNAAILGALLGWKASAELRAMAAEHRPVPPTPHGPLPTLAAEAGEWTSFLDALPADPHSDPGDRAFLTAAGRARRLLPPALADVLVDFADDPGPIGARLVRGVPIGDVPLTPPTPQSPTGKDRVGEFVLLSVARSLGQPVGYAPEHGGEVVQNLLPTPAGARRQTSTSSAVELEFHTETAFHPHKPRYLLLLCLRGDAAATTLLCSVEEILDQLPLAVRRVLSEPRYRTGVDESFTGDRTGRLGRRVPVLSGDPDHPTLTFDADLMTGVDDEAEAALAAFRDLARERRIGVVLEPGDLLVVDNHACIHGRSAFTARYDGTDRWLQRSFVVTDLSPSSADRAGRVITTRFS